MSINLDIISIADTETKQELAVYTWIQSMLGALGCEPGHSRDSSRVFVLLVYSV